MVKAGVFGATGYTGIELLRILENHDGIELVVATSEQYAGMALSKVVPSIRKTSLDVILTDVSNGIAKEMDVAILALPHTVSMDIVPTLLEKGVRVIDLSADYRLKDKALYEKVYGTPHTSSNLLSLSVYGICELNRGSIADAPLVAVPGCFPTSVIIPSYPLVKEGMVREGGIIADCKTGVSGGGRTPKSGFHYPEVEGGMMAYGFPVHRHTWEMNQELNACSGKEISVTFIPHLAPMVRGILSTMYISLPDGTGENKVRSVYEGYFNDEKFIRVYDPEQYPSTKNVSGSHFCDIGLAVRSDIGLAIVVCAIDNLVRGASGAAVQCLNVMYGFDEWRGIGFLPLFP